MNRDKLEQWVLLDEAGELDALRGWMLRRALARDAGLATFRRECRELARLSRAASPDVRMPDDTLGAIRQELAAWRQERGNGAAPSSHAALLRPVLALAAALTIGLAVYFLRPDRPAAIPGIAVVAVGSAGEGIDDDLDQLRNLLTSTASLDEAPLVEEEALARELLSFEGAEI